MSVSSAYGREGRKRMSDLGDDINKEIVHDLQRDLQGAMDVLPTTVSLTYGNATGGKKPYDQHDEVIAVLSFSETGFGFGEVAIKQTRAGVFIDTECMDMERIKRYFGMLLDSAITDTEEDPRLHALYNSEMGRRCGPGCDVCRKNGVVFGEDE